MNSVLFICSANICRSPMAMGLLRKRLAGEAGNWRIESAGVWAQQGQPAAYNTLMLLYSRDVDLVDHQSRPISRELMDDFNLVLTMERGHKEALRAAFPRQAHKVFLITELVGKKYDIEDPIGGPMADYELLARDLEYIFDQGLAKIRQYAQDPTEISPHGKSESPNS